jgi:hypothetical protein
MDFFGAQDTVICFKYTSKGTVVFDKTAYVKLKISKNFKQNIDETDVKQ